MSKNKTKKYPIVTYLCYLLAVCVLFTGVTFSRYTGSTSGSVNAELSRFACSYEITDVSATSFINSPYWIADGGGQSSVNTHRTMRYTVRNYNADGAASEVDLANTLRIYGPYDFICNLAWQMVEIKNDTEFTTITPQYVLGDVVSVFEGGATTFDTATSRDYNARSADAETLTLSGSLLNGIGTVSANCEESGNSFTLTGYDKDGVDYSVSFLRGEAKTIQSGDGTEVHVISKPAEPFYIDFCDTMRYCTLDIRLANYMTFSANRSEDKTFMIYFTIVDKMDDIGADSYSKYLTAGENGVERNEEYKNAVTGYHFDQKANVYDGDGNAAGSTATVRSVYDFQSAASTYYKVITDGNGAVTTQALTPVGEYCTDGEGKFYKISEFASPFSSASGTEYMIGQCDHKDYALVFKSIFIQNSRTGGGN